MPSAMLSYLLALEQEQRDRINAISGVPSVLLGVGKMREIGTACDAPIDPFPIAKDAFLDRVIEAGGGVKTADGIRFGKSERIAVHCEENWRGPHGHWLMRQGLQPCSGWVLIERPPTLSDRGGVYSCIDHREPVDNAKPLPARGETHKHWRR